MQYSFIEIKLSSLSAIVFFVILIILGIFFIKDRVSLFNFTVMFFCDISVWVPGYNRYEFFKDDKSGE